MLVLPADPGGGWLDARRSPDSTMITTDSDLVSLLSVLSRDGWESTEMLMPQSRPDRMIFRRARASRRTAWPLVLG
jgi:hypothetical protein